MAANAEGPSLTKIGYAYREVRRRVITGALAPGERIDQTSLAASLGLSLTPLREALRKLDAEGLVEFASHRYARPTPLTAEHARELFEVRRHLEPRAVSLGALRRTDDDIATIERTHAALVPITAHVELDGMLAHRAFHRSLYSASHNSELIGVLESLWDKADRYRYYAMTLHADVLTARLERAHRHHDALAESVIAGDAQRAEQVAGDLIDGSLILLAADALSRAGSD